MGRISGRSGWAVAVALLALAAVGRGEQVAANPPLPDPESPEVQRRIELVEQSDAQWRDGRVDAAIESRRQALAIEDTIFGPTSDRVLRTCGKLARGYAEIAEFDDARRYAARCREGFAGRYGPDSWQAEDAQTLTRLIEKLETVDAYERRQYFEAVRTVSRAWRTGDYEAALRGSRTEAQKLSAWIGRENTEWSTASIELYDALVWIGQTDGLRQRLEAHLADRERVRGPHHPDAAVARVGLADLLDREGDTQQAIELYLRAIEDLEAAGFRHYPLYGIAMNNLATAYDALSQHEQAIGWYRRSVAAAQWDASIGDSDLRKQHKNLASSYDSAAQAACLELRFNDAEKWFVEAAALCESLFGANDPRTGDAKLFLALIQGMAELSPEDRATVEQCYRLANQMSEAFDADEIETARDLAQQRADLLARVYGNDSLPWALALHDVANYNSWLDEEDATQEYLQVEPVYERDLPENHQWMGSLQLELSFRADDPPRKQLQRGKRALDIFKLTTGGESWEYADALTCYADTLQLVGRIEEARDAYRESVRIWRILYDTKSERYCNAVYGVAQTEDALGRELRAESLFLEAINLRKELFGVDDYTYGLYANDFANLLYEIDDYVRADQYYQISVDVDVAIGDGQTENAAVSLTNLARVKVLTGELDAARKLLEQSAAITAKLPTVTRIHIDTTLELASMQEDAEDFDAAEATLTEVTQAIVDIYGKKSVQYAEALRRRGELLHALGRTEEARQLWDEAFELLESLESQSDDAAPAALQEMADSVDSLTQSVSDNALLDAAVRGYELSYQLKQRFYPAGDWRLIDARLDAQENRAIAELPAAQRKRYDLAASQINKMYEYAKLGNYPQFREFAIEIIDVYRKTLGDDHRFTGDAYVAMAEVARQSVHYHDAYRWFEAAVENRRRNVGDRHPLYAECLQDLARAARDVQQFAEAEILLQETLDVQAELFGDQSADYADTLLTLAVVRQHAGDSLGALKPAKTSMDLHRRVFGADSLSYAHLAKVVAWIYHELDEDDRAIRLMDEAVRIEGAQLSSDDPAYWDAKFEAAVFLADFTSGREAAEQHLRQCIDYFAEHQGRFHPTYADALNTLGNVYVHSSRDDEALKLFREVLAVRQQTLGPDHANTGQAYSQVAAALTHLGQTDEAIRLTEKSLAIRQRVYGAESPELMIAGVRLAKLYARAGRFDESARQAQHSLQINRRQLQRAAAWTSEESLSAVADEGDDAYDLLLSLAVRDPDNRAVAAAAVDWTLRRKGAVLDALCNARSSQRVLAYEPGVAVLIDQLRELQQREAEASLASPSEGEDAAAKLDELQYEMGEVREAIAAKLQQRGVPLASFLEVDGEAVRKSLAEDEALVEFVCRRPFDFDTGEWLPNHYLALVATGSSPEWRVAELGPIKLPNAMIERMRVAHRTAQRQLQHVDEADLTAEFNETSHRLYETLFGALGDDVAEAKRLFVAADGFLHTAPLAVLAVEPGKFFIEAHDLAYVSSGRDLLRKRPVRGRGTLIFANPDFDLEAMERKMHIARLNTPAPPAGELLAMRSGVADSTRGLRWRRLPGAGVEAEQVSGSLVGSSFEPIRSYVGADALEDVFKSAPTPRILHVATHGFFLESQASDGAQLNRGPATSSAARMSQLRAQDNALLRSGIVFAGANRLETPEKMRGADDGWLTAMEIAALDLEGVELAVLSACNTGMGDVEAGEGVVGLQRAFLHAGAESLVTSLFEVPDQETQALMGEFYQRLPGSDSILHSFSEAQRAIIAQRRAEFGAAHPFYWGSFILVGTPR